LLAARGWWLCSGWTLGHPVESGEEACCSALSSLRSNNLARDRSRCRCLMSSCSEITLALHGDAINDFSGEMVFTSTSFRRIAPSRTSPVGPRAQGPRFQRETHRRLTPDLQVPAGVHVISDSTDQVKEYVRHLLLRSCVILTLSEYFRHQTRTSIHFLSSCAHSHGAAPGCRHFLRAVADRSSRVQSLMPASRVLVVLTAFCRLGWPCVSSRRQGQLPICSTRRPRARSTGSAYR
jgi:hypothetical protein